MLSSKCWYQDDSQIRNHLAQRPQRHSNNSMTRGETAEAAACRLAGGWRGVDGGSRLSCSAALPATSMPSCKVSWRQVASLLLCLSFFDFAITVKAYYDTQLRKAGVGKTFKLHPLQSVTEKKDSLELEEKLCAYIVLKDFFLWKTSQCPTELYLPEG